MLTLESEFRSNCPGCGVAILEFHSEGCDIQRCGYTGMQMHTCGVFDDEPTHSCISTTWDGFWPGVKECFEYELFAYFVPNFGFVPCKADHPEAITDLNNLIVTSKWDRVQQKWVR